MGARANCPARVRSVRCELGAKPIAMARPRVPPRAAIPAIQMRAVAQRDRVPDYEAGGQEFESFGRANDIKHLVNSLLSRKRRWGAHREQAEAPGFRRRQTCIACVEDSATSTAARTLRATRGEIEGDTCSSGSSAQSTTRGFLLYRCVRHSGQRRERTVPLH